MMKMNQFLLGLLVLVAVIEAIPRHEALRTEWDTWKKLHGNMHKYNVCLRVVRLEWG